MKPKIFIACRIFPEVGARLAEHFEVLQNPDDAPIPGPELARRLSGCAGMISSLLVRADGALADAVPTLRAVANITVGFNNFDLPALSERGVLATNTAGTLDRTTAELTWALLFAAARRITESERWLRAGQWKDAWSLDGLLGRDLHGATLGIVGMGRIGRMVAAPARAFGMTVIYHNRRRLDPALEAEAGGAAYRESLDDVLREADFVSLNLAYTPEAHHLIDARRIGLMKPTAILVNTSRGAVIEEKALIRALREGSIAGAGLDVFEREPDFDRDFLALDNVALTPHIGSATLATRLRMVNTAADNLIAALAGERPTHLLNPDAWERRRRGG